MFEILPNVIDYKPYYKGKFIRRIRPSKYLLDLKQGDKFQIPDEKMLLIFRAAASSQKISLKTQRHPNGSYTITKTTKNLTWWELREIGKV